MKRCLAVLLLIAFAGGASAETLPARPDDAITPGVVASTDITEVCGIVGGLTYSQHHRATSAQMKRAAYEAYHVNKAGREFEVDHRLPLALGGADDLRNLWPQPGFIRPSFHDKDRLEVYVWRAVCKTHTMALKDGQAIFLGDWIAGYERVFGRAPE